MKPKQYLRLAFNSPVEGDETEYFNLKKRCAGYIFTKTQNDMVGASCFYEVDVTDLWNEYQAYKSEADFHLTFNVVMMKALIEGLKVSPRLNAHLYFNKISTTGKLIKKKHIDISMPVKLKNGETFTIKVRETENKSLRSLQAQVDFLLKATENSDIDRLLLNNLSYRMTGFALKGKLLTSFIQLFTGFFGKNKVTNVSDLFKKRKLPKKATLVPQDVNEGTVCFTNWGMLNSKFTPANVGYTPLLYPQVFLYGIGTISDREYAFRNEKGEVDIGVKKIMPVHFTFDHRIGALDDVMPLIRKIEDVFEHPEIIREW